MQFHRHDINVPILILEHYDIQISSSTSYRADNTGFPDSLPVRCWSAHTGVSTCRCTSENVASSLFHRQYPACLDHLTLTVCAMGGKWPYSCCLVGFFNQDSFKWAYLFKHTYSEIFGLRQLGSSTEGISAKG